MKYITALLFIITLGIVAISLPQNVNAADRNDFNPGNIIDDAVFYNSNAINTAQIQTFLESKNPNCDYYGTQSAADWGYPNLTHAQIAEYKRNGTNGFARDSSFHAPPYKCLTMYSQATPQMEASSGYCNAIGAGTRTAAQIINDVAKACGINPQVLIILLEKEQSLITDKWPLDRQLRNATGFACPDTAPCDPSYAGFFYQVYHAARQFKVYQAFPNSYNYRAGRTNNIYWHPDLSRCGSSSVYIQNQATAALYIYTPYRPNEAALNNLYGTGDNCSSYGNRNFWRVFTDWFGSTRGFNIIPEISSRYTALGGVNGTLGIVSDGGYCANDRSVCWQSFKNGVIIYSSTTGAWESRGAIRERWAQLGYQTGILKFPTGSEISANNGIYQQYQNGRIYWKEGSGAWMVRGAIGDYYASLGAAGSYLGSPTSAEISVNGGVYQQFENGRIYWKEGVGAWTIHGYTGQRFITDAASNGPLGFPKGSEKPLVGGGVYQEFEKGTIYWKSGNAAWSVHGSTYIRYSAINTSQGYLGLPIGPLTSLSTGGAYQQFEKGRIYSKGNLGAWTIHGITGERYLAINADKGYLGYPIGAEISLGNGALYQEFENGRIYWKSTTGAWTIHGETGKRYLAINGSQSYLGLPMSGEIILSNGGLYQQFENGRIYWKSTTGAWTIHGETGNRYLSAGANTSYLGYPTSAEIPINSGLYQQFENGRIYWKDTTAAWIVHGGIAGHYNQLNTAQGSLGFPVGPETQGTASSVYQQFQNGRINWSNSKGAWVTS